MAGTRPVLAWVGGVFFVVNLFCRPRFSFRAAESLTLRTRKGKHTKNTANYAS